MMAKNNKKKKRLNFEEIIFLSLPCKLFLLYFYSRIKGTFLLPPLYSVSSFYKE